MDQDIVKRVEKVFRKVFSDNDLVITPSTTLEEIDGWDSMDHVSLIIAIEREFNVRLGLGEFHSFKNVKELLDLIENKNAQ